MSFAIDSIPFEDRQYALWLSPDLNIQALALHLRLALRAGHTALQIHQNGLQPSLKELLQAEVEENISLDVLKSLEARVELALKYDHLPFQRFGSYVQLSNIAAAENRFVEQITRLAQPQCSSADGFSDYKLNSEQLEAVRLALNNQVIILAGGPGTGKTYTVGRFLHAYAGRQDARFLRVILAAPTGKAAVQLEKSLLQAFEGNIPFTFEVKTIHSLIRRGSSIDAHVLIVDECSMIDTALFEQMLKIVPQGTKLVLVGDPDQLPPIGAGAPFAALVYAQESYFPRVHLREIKRSNESTLAALALHLREADPQFIPFLNNHREKENGPLSWYHLDSDSIKQRLTKGGLPLILSPIRFGPFGLQRLNESAQEYFKHVPIIVTKNDWTLKVTNGELGEKVRRNVFGQMRDFFKTDEREIPLSLLPAFETAYALSIHKSQGSEADRVLVVLPDGSDLFGWKLLYTACTRAKKRLEIFANSDTLEKTFANRQESYATLQQKLAESTKHSLL